MLHEKTALCTLNPESTRAAIAAARMGGEQ